MNNHLSLQLIDVGNTGSGLGQAEKYDGVKPINGILTPRNN